MRLVQSDEQTIDIPRPSAVEADPGPPTTLPVPFIPQSNYVNLCWAACCAMIDSALKVRYPDHFGNIPTRIEDVAGVVLGSNKCPSEKGAGIDRTCWPDCASNVLGYPCRDWPRAVSADYLAGEIRQARRPVGVYIEWNDGDAHVLLVVGVDPSGNLFLIHDPKSPSPHAVQWGALYSGNGAGRWTNTYLNWGYSL
jgi:hypothetical protein